MAFSEKVNPFNSELIHFPQRIKRPEGPYFLKENPDFVVKIEPDVTGYQLENCLESKTLYQELQNDWGIKVVDIAYFIGPSKLPPPPAYELLGSFNSFNIYRVTDRIQGKSLDEELPPIQVVDEHCSKLIDYFNHKLDADEPWLGDIIVGSQYVYGKRNGDETSTIYLVDVDYYSAHTPHENPDVDDETFLRYFWTLANEVRSYEMRYGKSLTSRRKLQTLLEGMQKSGRFEDDKRDINQRFLKFPLMILRAKPDRIGAIQERFEQFEDWNM